MPQPDHDVARGQIGPALSKRFTHDAPQRIPVHRRGKIFLAHDDPETRAFAAVASDCDFQTVTGAPPAMQQPSEHFAIVQTRCLRQTPSGNECAQADELLLDREANTALGAACAQHFAAADGFHAGAETVCAFALDHGWLVGTFHG